MIYVDTNVIISFVDRLDPNHEKAHKLLESSKDIKVVSKLSLVELASVYFRAGLEDPLALAVYSTKHCKLELVDVDFNLVLANAFKLASLIKLRTLNLLHVSVCKSIGAKSFLTFDKEILENADILREVDVKVVIT